jgi:ABC-2 type transport system permease protein
LLGKSLAYTLVGLGEALILFIVGFLLFQVRIIGDPTPLIIGTPVFIWVSVQLGLIIGIFTTTQSAAVQAIGTIKVLTRVRVALEPKCTLTTDSCDNDKNFTFFNASF